MLRLVALSLLIVHMRRMHVRCQVQLTVLLRLLADNASFTDSWDSANGLGLVRAWHISCCWDAVCPNGGTINPSMSFCKTHALQQQSHCI